MAHALPTKHVLGLVSLAVFFLLATRRLLVVYLLLALGLDNFLVAFPSSFPIVSRLHQVDHHVGLQSFGPIASDKFLHPR